MRFSMALPQTLHNIPFDADGTRLFVQRAEALGFEGLWASEQTLSTLPLLGPIEMLAFAAACTSRIRLGCAVFVATQHNPVHLAKSLSSLDHLSRGRLEVGLGIGGPLRMYSAFNAQASTIVARFNEALELMRRLWTDERINFDGEFWQLTNAAMEPKPHQQPAPPVWFGGSHPAALRRAARQANGFIGGGSSTTLAFADQVKILLSALEEGGRDPHTFPIAKRVYLALDDDIDRARQQIAAGLNDMYGYFGLPDLTPVAVYGDQTMVIEGLQAISNAGAQMILLNPMFNEAEQMERLVTEVLPHVE